MFERAGFRSQYRTPASTKHAGAAPVQQKRDATSSLARRADLSSRCPSSPSPPAQTLTRCTVCKSNDHPSFSMCPDLTQLKTYARYCAVWEHCACFNCLSFSHIVDKCEPTFNGKMKGCYILLIRSRPDSSRVAIDCVDSSENALKAGPLVKNVGDAPGLARRVDPVMPAGCVLLFIAQPPCLDAFGGITHLRAVLDIGSRMHVITQAAMDRLEMKISAFATSSGGVGGSESQRMGGRVLLMPILPGDTQLKVPGDGPEQVEDERYIARIITNFWKKFNDYQLTDPPPHAAPHIEILTGMANYSCLTLDDCIPVDDMWLQRTVFGWAVTTGKSRKDNPGSSELLQAGPAVLDLARRANLLGYNDSDRLALALVTSNGLQECQGFWQMEEPPDTGVTILAQEEERCKHFYDLTTDHLPVGRVRVSLPSFPNAPALGCSKAHAVRIDRLQNGSVLREKWTEFTREFLGMCHLELVANDKLELPVSMCLCLLDHGVWKESSITTLTVVYYGSTNTSVEVDYECLKGTQIQNNHCFTCAFFGIGIRSSDYHAIRALPYTVDYTVFTTARAIIGDFYMDDSLANPNLARRAKLLIGETTGVQMPTQKWCFNSREVLEFVPEAAREMATVNVANGVKVLGVARNMQHSAFVFVFPWAHKWLDTGLSEVKFTGRKLLAATSAVIDPLGRRSPFTVKI